MTATEKLNCARARARVEAGGGGPALAAHLAACHGCRDYAALRNWSRHVLRASELTVAPPPMAAVWAAIRRNSAYAWESALARSFRRLVPYLAGLTALLVIAGSLALRAPASPPDSGISAQVLLAPANALAANDLPEQAPSDLLGIGPR